MTGVLPIKKYSSGSALNMFDEYTFLKDRSFSEFFGFTEEEVKKLCKKIMFWFTTKNFNSVWIYIKKKLEDFSQPINSSVSIAFYELFKWSSS